MSETPALTRTSTTALMRTSNLLTGRRGAWLTLISVLIVFAALFGIFAKATSPALTDQAPVDSESARAAQLLDTFPDADQQAVILVATRGDGGQLTEADTTALADMASELGAGSDASAQLSEDGYAAVATLPITVGVDNTETAETITQLRSDIAADEPTGLDVIVTGGPAFGADVTAAFDGANFTLLAITIGVVAILLIVTYRSPILWLLPLTAVGLADGLAGRLTAAAGQAWELQFDAGIISILVFGAGANYALLLISRYREELQRTTDHRLALAAAWRGTVPAIVASNLTVILALATLAFAVIPGTRGLGLTAAIGLIIALVSVLLLLPPLLAVTGRAVFWPVIPHPDHPRHTGTLWRTVANRVVRRPVLHLTAGIGLLAIMATGLFGFSVGLDQMEKFRVQSDSAAGLEIVSEHFAPGEAQPILIVTNADAADDVAAAATEVEGVVRAHPVDTTADGELSSVMVTSDYDPSAAASLAQIEDLRAAVHDVPGADALVGGAVAEDVDARAGADHDLLVSAPLVLAVSFLILAGLLRSLIAPTVLLVFNVVSSLAAIGAGIWLSGLVFGQSSLDLQVPLLSFLFLVALGIDYSIFLVHRARTEAVSRGTRAGIVEAVSHTGAVITSAGVVLAAVFATLGVLPLVTLGQLGLIVGVGVIVDTVLVRTVLVPAAFALLGDRMWWPGSLRKAAPFGSAHGDSGAADHSAGDTHVDTQISAPERRHEVQHGRV